MASQQQIENALRLETKRAFSFSDIDTHVAIRIQYIGSEADGEVAVDAAGDFTFIHGDDGSEAVDSTIDSAGDDAGVIDITDTNANSWGEIVDLINASPNWRAFLEGARHGLAVDANSILTFASTTAKLNAGLAIHFDGANGKIGAGAITGHEFKNRTKNDSKVSDGMQDDTNCINVIHAFDVTVGNTGGGTFKIYEEDQDGNNTLLYNVTTVDDTNVNLGLTDIDAPVIMSSMGKRLIYELTAVTSYDDIAKYIINGAVRDFSGDRVP